MIGLCNSWLVQLYDYAHSWRRVKTFRKVRPIASRDDRGSLVSKRLDGSGYPKGLKEDEILIEARILAVADVVEAMSSHRQYRPALGIDEAVAEIQDGAGTRYDAKTVEVCTRLFESDAFSEGS